jgi:hypothetical protein
MVIETVAQAWESYIASAMDPPWGSVQYQEVRYAFYAGVFAALLVPASAGTIPDFLRVTDAWKEEVLQFNEDVKAGRA